MAYQLTEQKLFRRNQVYIAHTKTQKYVLNKMKIMRYEFEKSERHGATEDVTVKEPCCSHLFTLFHENLVALTVLVALLL